jgi:precorrin-6B methylase 2
MSLDVLNEVVSRSSVVATAFAAVGAALDARATGRPMDPLLNERVEEVLRALGITTKLDALAIDDAATMLGELQVYRSTDDALLGGARDGARWNPSDASLMQAAGAVSARVPRAIATMIAPSLGDLSTRLAADGAAFLDVGVGVAAMAIEMARTWPNLRVVGIDPWAPALAIARANVRDAHCEARIELREGAGEAMEDEHAFDLGWIPSLFVQPNVVAEVARRVRRSLRPGGWLLFPMVKTSSDPLLTAVMRLRVAQWGGWVADLEEGERMLTDAGFAEVRRLPSPPVSGTGMLAARAD